MQISHSADHVLVSEQGDFLVDSGHCSFTVLVTLEQRDVSNMPVFLIIPIINVDSVVFLVVVEMDTFMFYPLSK